MPAQSPTIQHSISFVAKQLKVHPSVIRRWEDEGKIKVRRNSRGHRVYSDAEIENLKKIHIGYNTRYLDRHTHTIKDLSKKLSVTPQTIRRWEETYGIDSARNKLKQRVYTNKQVSKFKNIQRKLNAPEYTQRKINKKVLDKALVGYRKTNWAVVSGAILISIFFVQQNTKLNLYQSMSYTQGIVRFGDNTTLARVVGKKIFGSIDAAGVLTFKNLQV